MISNNDIVKHLTGLFTTDSRFNLIASSPNPKHGTYEFDVIRLHADNKILPRVAHFIEYINHDPETEKVSAIKITTKLSEISDIKDHFIPGQEELFIGSINTNLGGCGNVMRIGDDVLYRHINFIHIESAEASLGDIVAMMTSFDILSTLFKCIGETVDTINGMTKNLGSMQEMAKFFADANAEAVKEK